MVGRRIWTLAAMSLALVCAAPRVSAQSEPQKKDVSFVVLGHVRGDHDGAQSPLLDELIEKVRALRPDGVFLTGDMVWGAAHSAGNDRATLEADWARLDAKLDTLGVPIYRVPGNHDINDPVSRDVYRERYGQLPATATMGNCLFILLNSTYVPRGDGVARKYIRTARLDDDQVEFVRRAVEEPGHEHVFVMMHHVLWWAADAPWWEDVHPLLAGHHGRAVFSGDLGPSMFTHQQRDGVHYVRSVIGAPPVEPLAQQEELADAVMSQQMDCFLHVVVHGEDVRMSVETVGALSQSRFSPAAWETSFGKLREDPRWVYDPEGPSPGEVSIVDRARDFLSSPRRVAALAVGALLAFGAGVLIGTRRARRPAGRRA